MKFSKGVVNCRIAILILAAVLMIPAMRSKAAHTAPMTAMDIR